MVEVEVDRVLVVDRDPATAEKLQLDPDAEFIDVVDAAADCRSARPLLNNSPELVVIDVASSELGAAVQLVEAARALPQAPVIVLMGNRADAVIVAQLILRGADAYLDKPLLPARLGRTVEAVSNGVEQCERMARQLVGRIGLKDAIQHLRGTMNTEALARTGGSRRAAADLLGVHRSYVQRLLAECGERLEQPELDDTAQG